jgi:hypothetical protein
MKLYGCVPPETVRSIEPVGAPKHKTSVTKLVAVGNGNTVTVTSSLSEHPFGDVTVTV